MSRGVLIFWGVILALFLAVGVTVFFRMQGPSSRMDPAKMPKAVELHTVIPRPVAVTYDTQGAIEAANRVDLNVESAGLIKGFHFEEGDRVRAGQPLITLKRDRQEAQRFESLAAVSSTEQALESRRAAVEQSKAEVEETEASLELARSEFERFQELKDKDYISALELEQKQTAYRQAQARLRVARKRLTQATAALSQAESQLEQAEAHLAFQEAVSGETIVRAPFDGLVGRKYVDLGDYVMPAERLLTLVDNRYMNVIFPVPERYLPHLEPGRPVTLMTVGDARWEARVKFIEPAVDPATRTVAVKARLSEEAARHLRDGQSARVRLTLDTRPDGLVVPEEALVPQGEKFFVYRAVDGVARFTEVTIGEREPGWVEITEGLESGARVVTSGTQKLFDGARLKPVSDDKAQARAGQD